MTDDTVRRAIAGLELRGIGPAFMGGRIADIAIHPDRPHTWFVAVGSGGVWKSTNAGITWAPVFDDQASYSIGCVRIDPSDPDRVWVGTGEAVSGRHVAWGNGVYRSDDAGHTWHHLGLEWSEHISDILIDPRDSDVVHVAAEGPLWSSGGERGLYTTTDRGRHWTRSLHIDGDTGVTSAVFAPDDPDTIYAASYQRRRRVWSFVGGGPGSGVHVSTDRGRSWRRMTVGLPTSDIGRIGLAVTPADPSVVYATIEAADRDQQGFHRSADRGRTWERRSGHVSGGTGPHYYQELFASPSTVDLVYQVDVFLQVTRDGGRTFTPAETGRNKHSDNHVVWIDPAHDQHLIVGADAGLYETFDGGVEWRHVSNLPISQFYRVAVDDSLPFARVLGGAQDLGTLHGPVRTTNVDGVRNQDWTVRLGADGYHAAFDPHDDRWSYVSWQVGNVLRHDREMMELVDIQPQPGADEAPERWNWDAPFVVSPHQAGRLHLASHRVWRSDDRGDSWTPISGDLTTGANRYELATTGRVESVDALHDHLAMSYYATISALAESPIDGDLLYAGTDDGRLHATDDGGTTWRELARPEGMSEVAFVNGFEPSRHDADVVFVAFDDHKSGDYTPYVFRSDDRGHSWQSIRGDLPDGTIVWTIVQDHDIADLLFVGAEHGAHASLDGGVTWHKLSGVPTIAFRDLAVQRRDDDLVGATFGRGLQVLDDYSPLRELSLALQRGDEPELLATGVHLFAVRDAWWYEPTLTAQAVGQPTLGSTAWRAPNPDFGATFTVHVSDDTADRLRSRRDVRRADEKEPIESGDDVTFPGWQALRDERVENAPSLAVVVRTDDGTPVRSLPVSSEAGLHRTTWDLRHAAPDAVDLREPGFRAPWDTEPRGPLAVPGRYTAEVVEIVDGGVSVMAGPSAFMVTPLPDAPAVEPEMHAAHGDFRTRTASAVRRAAALEKRIAAARDRVKHLRTALAVTPTAVDRLPQLLAAHETIEQLAVRLLGDPVLLDREEPAPAALITSIRRVAREHWATTGAPTGTQRTVLERTEAELPEAERTVSAVLDDLGELSRAVDADGGPYTPR